jgi:hypothetical protein
MRMVHADMHLGDHGVVAPVCDLLSALSRHEKSARLLPASEVVTALRDVLVGYLGRWDVCSTALRASNPPLARAEGQGLTRTVTSGQGYHTRLTALSSHP